MDEEDSQKKFSSDELIGLIGTGIDGYRAMKEARENKKEEEFEVE